MIRFLLLSILLYSVNCFAENRLDFNLAYYYGINPPLNKLKFYKNIVVQPYNSLKQRLIEINNKKLFAYASLGEVNTLNQYAAPINESWVIAKNHQWQTLVLDQTNPDWQRFFVNEVIAPLWAKGYRNFLLDTVDSYRLASEDVKQMAKQQAGIIAIIHAIKQKYPDAQLILNRGFEILPQVKSLINGVMAESLFSGWDEKNKRYFSVSEKERERLLIQLKLAQKMGIPVTVVDYLAPANAGQAKSIAEKIAKLGFNPWVTNGKLTKLYLSNVETIPRKILLFYQGALNNVDEKVGSYVSKAVTMPLNYMGYVTELHNIEEPLPQNLAAGDYAGIVVAIDGILLGREKELYNWYLDIIKKKIPFVVLDNFGFPLSDVSLTPFHLSIPLFTYNPHSLKVAYKSPMLGYEIVPRPKRKDFLPLKVHDGQSLLTVMDEVGTESDVAAITTWGGYYISPDFLIPLIGANYRWTINPFKFFKQALRLPELPTPDTTTENGRRLMFVHIDGDGFANRGEWYKGPFVGEILRNEFFEYYAIPTTVSVIQGEISKNGLHPNISPQLEKIARQIFALPYVEIASHTFSHPYNWRAAADYKGKLPNPYTLPIPNYHFNLYNEINGSVDYINKNLAPAGKKCNMFLWSGEGDVPEKALQLVHLLGLGNLNPGTIITKYNQSMSRVSALGINEGPYYQVFAPIGNDDETIAHSRIFYSLIAIIEALKLTEEPVRLKPIDIYYHFYSVSQKGGIKALHAVYDWALKQAVMNIYASDYYNKIVDFNQLAIAKKEGGWWFETNDELRELRLPITMGYPDLTRSQNIIGYSTYHKVHYVHLGPGGEAMLWMSKNPPTLPFLIDANTRVTRFTRTNKGIDFALDGYLPAKFRFANMQNCALWRGKKEISPRSQQDNQNYYEFKKGTKYELSIRCN